MKISIIPAASCLTASVLLFSACHNDTVFEQSYPIPGGVWVWQDTAQFTFAIADTTLRYDLSLTIDHQLQYAHQNIYLRLKTRFPNGQRTTDVQSLDFYNSTGQSTGDCSGGNCQVTFDLQKNARFRLPGDYSLTVEQWMRRDSVTGIKNITLAVKKSKP